jgi:hypothetical protein
MCKNRKEKFMKESRTKKPKPLVLAFALPEAEHQQLHALAAKFELNDSAIARKALKLGMERLNTDGAFFAVPREEK